MDNNPLDIVKEIVSNYVAKKDLTVIERAFINAVSKREEIKVQLDEYDETIKYYGELDRAGDYLYVSYNSWSELPYSLQAIAEARLEPWKWNGVNIQYSRFLEWEDDIMRLLPDDAVAHLCSVAHYKELIVFRGATALKMRPVEFKKLNDRFEKNYRIIKSYSTKIVGMERLLEVQNVTAE